MKKVKIGPKFGFSKLTKKFKALMNPKIIYISHFQPLKIDIMLLIPVKKKFYSNLKFFHNYFYLKLTVYETVLSMNPFVNLMNALPRILHVSYGPKIDKNNNNNSISKIRPGEYFQCTHLPW